MHESHAPRIRPSQVHARVTPQLLTTLFPRRAFPELPECTHLNPQSSNVHRVRTMIGILSDEELRALATAVGMHCAGVPTSTLYMGLMDLT
ncbi:MAG TPA: hypothetical protein VD997_12425 [Phycisphaerales bacterium]|nr:hypothetical protein [Phycisphaerales bacterium]